MTYQAKLKIKFQYGDIWNSVTQTFSQQSNMRAVMEEVCTWTKQICKNRPIRGHELIIFRVRKGNKKYVIYKTPRQYSYWDSFIFKEMDVLTYMESTGESFEKLWEFKDYALGGDFE